MSLQHNAAHQVDLLREALQSDKVSLGCFLGAGCPLGVYDDHDATSLKLIPDVAGLTAKIQSALSSHGATNHRALWDKLVDECTGESGGDPTVEDVLGELRTLHGRRGRSDVLGASKDELGDLDAAICDAIVEEVDKDLPSHKCSYRRFAAWAGGIQRLAPLEIFTPNYDLLIEEAFEQFSVPLFDGFIGSKHPFFDIASIEQDLIPFRWARLWKIHGSMNWERREDGTVFRATGRAKPKKAMIYPSHLKYDQSRRMPYLAMLDRLKAFFRAPSRDDGQRLGPPVLVVCGYSFSDDHINEVLLEGLNGNPSAHCFVLEYKRLDDSASVVEHARRIPQPYCTSLGWGRRRLSRWFISSRTHRRYAVAVQGKGICRKRQRRTAPSPMPLG